MNKRILDANKKAVAVIDHYQHIKFGERTITPPYFINSVEMIYRNIFLKAGASPEVVDLAIKMIRHNETPLDGRVGKGTPEEFEAALIRLRDYLLTQGINLAKKDDRLVRIFMKAFHLGIDCSGFVFNVLLKSLSAKEFEELLLKLSWINDTNRTVTQAWCAVYQTDKLSTITDISAIQPLDLLVLKDLTHIGIVIYKDEKYFLADSSIELDGITLHEIDLKNSTIIGREEWNKHITRDNVMIKRVLE